MSRAKNRSEARRILRRRLEAQGYSPQRIDLIVAQREIAVVENHDVRERQRRYFEQEAQLDELRQTADVPAVFLDDSGYRPTRYDPLTIGPARVSGETAKAVRRGSTITAWQHRERNPE